LADSVLRNFRAGHVGAAWLRGVLALREGDLLAAEAYEHDAVENAIPSQAGHTAAALALVMLEQGDVAAGRMALERAGLFGDVAEPMYLWGPYVRGRVLLAEGRSAGALKDFLDVGRHATEVGGFAGGLDWQGQAALALHALGDQAASEEAAARQLERARQRGAPRFLGMALRVQALVGRGEDRLARLAEAVGKLEGSGARLELARARCDLGVALLRAGRRSEGRAALEAALEEARACGARGLAGAARDEVRIAGARPRRLSFSGWASLTASERRVAEMAATGRTNREIAQALFVTPKTVENHLSRVYTKLGVSSRRELAIPQAAEAGTTNSYMRIG
jgi:DNA-binding CsgD family transcriptional regulator